MNKNGTILIVSIWVLTILALLAVGVGFRMGLEIKLTGFNVSGLKALYLAKAGINRATAGKWLGALEGKAVGIDAMSQPWSNDEENFRDIELGEGKFTVSYQPCELDRSDKPVTLFGMQDEYSRININSEKTAGPLKILLMDKGLELEEAVALADAIRDWRDSDNTPSLNGAEDSYYQDLEKPYHASNSGFKTVDELLLVKGMTEELFEEIAGFLTVFGEGKININTASEPVLNALFGVGFSELAEKIIVYRRGFDGKPGTSDDRWFASGSYVVKRESMGLVTIKNLNDNSWSGNMFGVRDTEWKRIKELAGTGLLVTSSDTYRINVAAQVMKVKKHVTAVVKFKKHEPLAAAGFKRSLPPPDVEYLYWQES